MAFSSYSRTVAVVLMAVLCGASAAKSIEIEQKEVLIPTVAGPKVSAHVFTMTAKKVRTEVLPTSLMRTEHSRKSRGVPIVDAADHPLVRRVVAERALLVTGGFSESASDQPDGLLIYHSQTISLPNFAKSPAQPGHVCPLLHKERYRLSGALCVRPDRSLQIQPIVRLDAAQCEGAIQAGPILVGPSSQVAVCSSESSEAVAKRASICLRGEKVSIVITTQPIRLFDLATWLANKADNDSGLGCEDAINLPGQTSAAAVYYPGGLPSFTKRKIFGDGTFPLASVILIHGNY